MSQRVIRPLHTWLKGPASLSEHSPGTRLKHACLTPLSRRTFLAFVAFLAFFAFFVFIFFAVYLRISFLSSALCVIRDFLDQL